jgi:hypothetical protein
VLEQIPEPVLDKVAEPSPEVVAEPVPEKLPDKHETNNPNRTQLIRLIRELEPGHRLTDDGDKVVLDVVRQLIFHTVWLAEELRVAQEEIDRLIDGNQ